MEDGINGDEDEYRNSAPVQTRGSGKRLRSYSYSGSSKGNVGEGLRSLQTMPSPTLLGALADDEDIDEEDYEQRPLSQTFACHVVTIVYPNGSQTSVVIGEEDQTLRQVRAQLDSEKSTSGLSFSYRVGHQDILLTPDQECSLFSSLLSTTNIRTSVRDESLCLYLTAGLPESSAHPESRGDGEVLREYVNVWELSVGEARDNILLVKQGRVELYESEMVLLAMNGQVDVKLRLKDIQNLQFLEGESDTVVVIFRANLNMQDTAVKFLSEEGCSLFLKHTLPYIYSLGEGGQRVLETRRAPVQITESRHYFVRKVNHYGFKQKRLVWLELLNFKLHISDLSMRNHKVYEMRRLAHFVKRGDQEKKLSILFKEGSGQKDLHLVFSSVEELTEFFTIAENSLLLKQDHKFQIKKTLFFTQQLSSQRKPGKVQRKYSWLSQEATDTITRMSRSEYYFNVVNDTFLGHDKRILLLNREEEIMGILTSDGKAIKSVRMKSIADLSHDIEDHRKLTITDEHGAKHILVFPNVYLKVLFCNIIYLATQPHLALRQIYSESLRLFVGTWNLGHCAPPTDQSCFAKWIAAPGSFEIVVLGFQECAKSKRAKWLQKLTNYLEAAGLRLVSFIPMWEMFLIVFTKKELQVSHLSVIAKPTGIANMIGNKGGCVATFKVKETSFCFVSCHLAAQPHNTPQRNQNAKDLFSIRLGHQDLDFPSEYDYFFWFGDLNYRIDREFSAAVAMLDRKEYSSLWGDDQLLKEQRANRAFVGFREGELSFAPTYRYVRGMNEWSNKRNQTPSWTDRILFRSYKEIELLDYTPALDCYGSDHRPLSAQFLVKVRPWFFPEQLPRPGADPVFTIVEFSELTIVCEDQIGSTHGQVVFFGQFLMSTPSTPQFGVSGPEIRATLVSKQLPILTCAIADPLFLRDQRVVLVLYLSAKERTEVAGLASLCFATLCDSIISAKPELDLSSPFTSDEFIDISMDLEFAGRRVGCVTGKWSFSLCHKSQQDH